MAVRQPMRERETKSAWQIFPLRSGSASLATFALAAFLMPAVPALAQWAGRNGWIEEPGVRSLNVGGGATHAYLDSQSVHRGSDGLIYFNESSDVSRPDQIGKTGLMADAYDCSRNIKYMCVEQGDWRHDPASRVDTTHSPALTIYRRYLCDDQSAEHDAKPKPPR